MNVNVWVLIVDAGTGELGLSVHGSYADALTALRVNYADGDVVTDEDLVQHVESQGLVVTIEKHEVVPPGPLTDAERARLADLRTRFEAAGGRGVDLAEEIDALAAREES